MSSAKTEQHSRTGPKLAASRGKGRASAFLRGNKGIFIDAAAALALGGTVLASNFCLLTTSAAWACVAAALIKTGAALGFQRQGFHAKGAKGDQSGLSWESFYAVASVMMAAATGLLVCAVFLSETPASLGMAATIATIGAVALAPARSSARPGLVYWQAVCALPLFAFGLCARWDSYSPIALVSMAGVAFAVFNDAKILSRTKADTLGKESQLASAMDSTMHSLAMFDLSSRFIAGNKRFLKTFGLTEIAAVDLSLDDMLARKFAAGLKDKGDLQALDEARKRAAQKHQRSNLVVNLVDERFLEFAFQPMAQGFSLLIEDVTRRRETEMRIERMARLDDLTGLSNRVHCREQLEAATAAGAYEQASFAVMLIDLDRFKQVNDSLGHPVGDKLLKKVGERLQKMAGPRDTVARLGGDEFVILRFGDREDAGEFAAKAIATLSAYYHIDGDKLLIGASLGIAMMPEDGADADELLRSSDMALYAAKDSGRGTFRFFEKSMAEKAMRRQQIENDLRIGIARNELEVYYQPIISFHKRRISCCEALVRWRHPTRGVISPAEFIEIAEESGLVVQLGEWVLRQACIDALAWPREVRLAVNFSAVQFKRSDVVELVRRILRETKFPAARLEMEITESVLMNDGNSVLAAIDELRDLGMRVALDDFGTGYSSLSYLSRFRPDKVKIDQSFVRNMALNGASLAIIKAVKAITDELGVDMLVEGVETVEQLEVLRDNGADEAQGYLFSKPRPAREIAQLVADPAQLIRGRNLILEPCAPWMKHYERVAPADVRRVQ